MNPYLSWAEIDLSAISHNLRELRRITRPSARLMAVIKANAYGHGALEIARLAESEPVDWLGVANIHEGIALRKAGITLPILIFGYTPGVMAPALQTHGLTQTVTSFQAAEALSFHLSPNEKPLDLHLKMDTGMGRMGFFISESPEDMDAALNEAKLIAGLKGVHLQGICTHFAHADAADKTYTRTQFSRFLHFLDLLKSMGIRPEIVHAANSAAVIDLPETHLDMVRPGISIYGSYPSDAVDKTAIALQPAMTVKTRIIQLKHVRENFKISYNMTYETRISTTIAAVPIGYADGYNRLLSSRGFMLVRGQRAPVVGRVCMDLTMIDVGHIPDVALEDEVVVFGKQGRQSIRVEELAAEIGAINYEIYTRIGDRVERIYLT